MISQKLLESGKKLNDPSLAEGHTNYYRNDDVGAVAYFYLDRPEGGLQHLSGAQKIKNLANLRMWAYEHVHGPGGGSSQLRTRLPQVP